MQYNCKYFRALVFPVPPTLGVLLPILPLLPPIPLYPLSRCPLYPTSPAPLPPVPYTLPVPYSLGLLPPSPSTLMFVICFCVVDGVQVEPMVSRETRPQHQVKELSLDCSCVSQKT